MIQKRKRFDEAQFITAMESGRVPCQADVIAGVQALIDNGSAWKLRGTYGRLAKALIDAGYCHIPNNN